MNLHRIVLVTEKEQCLKTDITSSAIKLFINNLLYCLHHKILDKISIRMKHNAEQLFSNNNIT